MKGYYLMVVFYLHTRLY